MLKVENLCKNYPSFSLKNVSFELPKGYIMGFIGTNGAGKTTTLKTILNMVHSDGGSVEIFGMDMSDSSNELKVKQKIGFMFGEADYYTKSKIKVVTGVYKRFFDEWSDDTYHMYMKKFELDENKQIGQLSSGMKVKYALSLALSHNAKLLICDEPTSGLDPIARDEILEIFQELVESGERSILFSTHITSDLDKCADFIIFIRRGEIALNDTKDDLINSHVVVSGAVSDLTSELESRIIGIKVHNYNFVGLMRAEDQKEYDKVQVTKPNLEDLMIYYNREGKTE